MKKDDIKNGIIECLMVLGIRASIGALTGLGLSFTALSPLVMGGIVDSIAPALVTALYVGCLLYKFYKKDHIKKDDKEMPVLLGIFTLASAAIGVGLAAAAIAIFPSATLGMGSAALAGATIGVIAPIITFCAVAATVFAAKKVNEYIVSPIVEKVGKCFSSKEEECNLPAK